MAGSLKYRAPPPPPGKFWVQSFELSYSGAKFRTILQVSFELSYKRSFHKWRQPMGVSYCYFQSEKNHFYYFIFFTESENSHF